MKHQPLWDVLERFEREIGTKLVRETLKQYMMRKTYAGVLPEVRRRIPKSWVLDAFAKQNGICICGQEMAWKDVVGDHIKPLAKGGLHNRHNIRAMHRSCNAAKGANTLAEEAKRTGKTVLTQLTSPHQEDTQ